jgi:hypothetical protein
MLPRRLRHRRPQGERDASGHDRDWPTVPAEEGHGCGQSGPAYETPASAASEQTADELTRQDGERQGADDEHPYEDHDQGHHTTTGPARGHRLRDVLV